MALSDAERKVMQAIGFESAEAMYEQMYFCKTTDSLFALAVRLQEQVDALTQELYELRGTVIEGLDEEAYELAKGEQQ